MNKRLKVKSTDELTAFKPVKQNWYTFRFNQFRITTSECTLSNSLNNIIYRGYKLLANAVLLSVRVKFF